jgi:hypothetical protein
MPQERVTLQQRNEQQARQKLLKAYKVPALCPGGTVVCLGSGPSLKKEDIDLAHERGATIIAVNDAYLLAPFAAALMASDGAWWIHKKPEFAGMRFSLDPSAARCKDVVVLKNTGTDGIEVDPAGLKTCRNSGGAAVNLAVHFIGAAPGTRKIILLGYDMDADNRKHSHFFGNHKFPLRDGSPYQLFRDCFKHQVGPLRQLGIDIVNCSRKTALKCFRLGELAQELP